MTFRDSHISMYNNEKNGAFCDADCILKGIAFEIITAALFEIFSVNRLPCWRASDRSHYEIYMARPFYILIQGMEHAFSFNFRICTED